MHFTEIKAENLLREYSVLIPGSDYESRMEVKLLGYGKKAKVPGFRPGKIPLQILKQKYEAGFARDVMEESIDQAIKLLLKEKDLKPAVRPDVELKSISEDKSIEIEVKLEVLPVVDPINLEAIEIDGMTSEIDESEIDKSLQGIRNLLKTFEEVSNDQVSKLGDVLEISFVGTCNGKPIEGGSGDNFDLELGSGSFIDNFEDQLVGKKAGDHVTVNVTFPDAYHSKDLAGQKAVFEVNVLKIKEKKLPDIDSALAERIGYKSLEEFNEMLRKRHTDEIERMSFVIAKRNLLDKLSEIKFDIPHGLRDLEFNAIWDQYLSLQKENEGSGGDKVSDEELEKEKAQYMDIAERRVRLGLILADIGKIKKIEVTKAEFDQALITAVRRYPGKEKQAYEYFTKNSNALAALRAPIFEDKVVKFIFDIAKVNNKIVSFSELEKAFKDITEGDDD